MRPTIITLFLFLIALGVVAVENFRGEKTLKDLELFPEQFPSLETPKPTNIPTISAEVEEKWNVFSSVDHSFRFRYPPEWKIIETITSRKKVRGVFGMPVQSWGLANFEPSGDEEIFPENAVRIEFEILTEGRKQSTENLLDCQGANVIECKHQLINGVVYKKTIIKSREGIENIILATVKEDKIYRISGSVNADKNQEGVSQVEQVINTFEIMQQS
ncbi:MAG: hypothetical protein ACOX50_00900 [Patescibacteria group bacterium]|jgi:hypothetical protein